MKSERKGPMSRDRPEAAAEHSEDRVRTVAQPLPWTASRASYASVKGAASKADPPRRATPAQAIREPSTFSSGQAGRALPGAHAPKLQEERFPCGSQCPRSSGHSDQSSKRTCDVASSKKGAARLRFIRLRCARDFARLPAMTRSWQTSGNVGEALKCVRQRFIGARRSNFAAGSVRRSASFKTKSTDYRWIS